MLCVEFRLTKHANDCIDIGSFIQQAQTDADPEFWIFQFSGRRMK